MYRPLFIAALVLLLVSVPLAAPLSAQHGGGHGSGGGHGFGGGHGGGFGGGHAFSGGHSGSGFAARPSGRAFVSHPSARSFASRPSSAARGLNRSGGARIRTYDRRNHRYLYGGYGGYGYPGWYGGFYDPYWWWDSGSAFDYEKQYETGLANEMNEQSLEEQRLRAQSDPDVYAKFDACCAARKGTLGYSAGYGTGFPRSAQTGSAELRHRRPDSVELCTAAYGEDSAL